MKHIILTTLGLALTVMSAPTPPTEIEKLTDHYLFNVTIDEFITTRNSSPKPPGLDWSADGCSSSPDDPFGFDC